MENQSVAIICRKVKPYNGTPQTILEQARRLVGHRWSVHVFGDDLNVKAIEETGAVAHVIPVWMWPSSWRREVFAAQARRLVSAGSFDLVHGHGDSLSQDILSLHNCVHAAHEAVWKTALPSESRLGRFHSQMLSEGGFYQLIANSRLMREEVTVRFGFPRERISVIYPGYNPYRFRWRDRGWFRQQTRSEMGVGKTDILFGLVTSGDLTRRGAGVFLEALARLKGHDKERFKAVIIGKQDRFHPYERRAREMGLSGRVRFFPPVGRVEKYFHALDVYVLPAYYEEFGQCLQQAMACGVPVITTAQTGASELMPAEAQRFVLGVPDAEALVAKMRVLSGSAVLRQRIGMLCASAIQGNTWERNFSLTLANYGNVLAAKLESTETASSRTFRVA